MVGELQHRKIRKVKAVQGEVENAVLVYPRARLREDLTAVVHYLMEGYRAGGTRTAQQNDKMQWTQVAT